MSTASEAPRRHGLRAFARRHGTSLGLCLLALVLVVAVLLDRARSGGDDGGRDKDRLFTAWREAEITAVRIGRADSVLELAREPGGSADEPRWRLHGEGQELDSDGQAVGQLLATLELARYERRVDAPGIDPKQLGLGQPELSIELTMGRATPFLHVGAQAPSPVGSHYAEVGDASGGRTVVVLSKELCGALGSAVEGLRSHKLFPFAPAQAESLLLRGPDGLVRWTLRRGELAGRGSAGFRVSASDAEGGMRADWREVEALLAALSGLEAESFVPAEAIAAPGGAARLGLEVRGKDPAAASVKLELRGPCPDRPGVLLVRSAPRAVAACVSERAVAAWDVPADRLVDRYVVGAEESAVIELKLSGAGRMVEVARREDGWHMRAPRDEQADTDTVAALLKQMLALHGTMLTPAQAADPGPLGLGAPDAKARIVSLGDATRAATEERIEQLEIGAPKDGTVHVRRLEDGAVLSLPEAEAEALRPRVTTLRSTTVYELPPRRVQALRIVAAGAVRQELGRSEDGASWILRGPTGAGLEADPTLAATLAEELARLRAVRWVADGPEAAFKLSEPWCTIEASLGAEPGDARAPDTDDAGSAGGAEPDRRRIRLRLGNPTEGGYFAQHDDDPAVLVVPRSLGELGCHWLLDRAALMADPKALVRISLESARSDKPLVVEQAADGWQVAGKGPASADTALRVRDAVADMMAEGVVHLGAARTEEQLGKPVLKIEVELRQASGKPSRHTLRVGAGDSWRDTNVFYVRREGLDVTYAVAQSRLRPLLELF